MLRSNAATCLVTDQSSFQLRLQTQVQIKASFHETLLRCIHVFVIGLVKWPDQKPAPIGYQPFATPRQLIWIDD